MILRRVWGRKVGVGVYRSQTTRMLVIYQGFGRAGYGHEGPFEENGYDLDVFLSVFERMDCRRRQTHWEPPGAWLLYFTTGLWVRLVERRNGRASVTVTIPSAISSNDIILPSEANR